MKQKISRSITIGLGFVILSILSGCYASPYRSYSVGLRGSYHGSYPSRHYDHPYRRYSSGYRRPRSSYYGRGYRRRGYYYCD